MKDLYKGSILLFLSAFGFGILPIFALYAYKAGISITTLLFLRFFIAAILFFIYTFLKIKKISLTKSQLFSLFLLGGVGYNLQARFYFSSLQYIPASLTALLLYTYPIVVTALAFFIDKEKITGKLLVSVGISFVGLILILGTSVGKINGLGILLALGASLVYSLYIVLGNRVVKKIPPLVTSAFISLFASAGVLILGGLLGDINFNFQKTAWPPVLGLVLFSTVLSILTFFRGLELLGPTKASILSMIEPVFTIILSAAVLQDKPAFFQLAGGAIVLVGSIMVILSKDQNKSEEAGVEETF